ncbi:hypothetical protein [Cohnella sp. 56]|uniref:hypothetical protein n=1 Tax=Cohnella sp. 56 TaxID=3113722 RepID=UPI0030EACCC9
MKRMLSTLLLCGAVWGSCAAAAAAQTVVDKDQNAVLRRLSAESGGRLEVRWHAETGTPSLLLGKLSPPSAHSPAWIAGEFVTKTRRLYGIRNPHSHLKIVHVEKLPEESAYRVHLQHYLYKTPVWGDELRIEIGGNGVVERVEGRIYPDLAKAISNRPRRATVSQAEAIRIAAAAAAGAAGPGAGDAPLDTAQALPYYLPSRTGIPLVYAVTLYPPDQPPVSVMVHALTGRTIAH